MPVRPIAHQLKNYHRYAGYDYARGASLFVSLSTEPRRCLFDAVVADHTIISGLISACRALFFTVPIFSIEPKCGC